MVEGQQGVVCLDWLCLRTGLLLKKHVLSAATHAITGLMVTICASRQQLAISFVAQSRWVGAAIIDRENPFQQSWQSLHVTSGYSSLSGATCKHGACTGNDGALAATFGLRIVMTQSFTSTARVLHKTSSRWLALSHDEQGCQSAYSSTLYRLPSN